VRYTELAPADGNSVAEPHQDRAGPVHTPAGQSRGVGHIGVTFADGQSDPEPDSFVQSDPEPDSIVQSDPEPDADRDVNLNELITMAVKAR
jgi:hypothetical protein